MTTTIHNSVLAEVILPRTGQAMRVKQIILVLAGIAALALAAKIKIPMIPVPMTMGTFAVLSIGAAYGMRLGLATIIGYMLIGALGFDVFAGSSAETFGMTYMMGGTGGYLVGYVLAVLALGYAARQRWDRSIGKMALAMILGNILIYVPGLIWLAVLYGTDAPIFAWGLTPFLLGDLVKLALAALLLPAIWRFVGAARK
ncbi:MAG: biotin transporter BioY [Planktomarina sp.]|jgi:biotin transport system substrate-specific component|nr:biotin transporter BioY [Planktomarina sp.]MDT2058598.1 biotin transporter BioY [Planktomarina sp.]MDT2073476.1 biotin transporter BioY [Planktomarina sp.]MDT2078671.1 biotin transporter BioY [Planktomarina sp.]|tara:strand:+ start:529 stop:1128 length:600 start_codon:yes stop_codon:yes gene_type:complete